MRKSKNKCYSLTKLKVLITVMVVMSLFTGCQEQRYLVVVFNNSEQNIDDVTLWFEDRSFEYGTIQKNTKSYIVMNFLHIIAT